MYKFFNIKKETFENVLLSKDYQEFSEAIFSWFSTLQLKKETSWKQHYQNIKINNPLQYLADYGTNLWLQNDSNVKVDRASMAYSVEVRSPFLDYRVLEYARNLPTEYKFHKGVKKRIIKDLLEEYIPREIFESPKKGFSIPLKQWLRNDLREKILKDLNDEFLSSVPNLDVEKFKKQLKSHMNSQDDYTFNIWKIYILKGWMKQYKLDF